MKDPYRLFKKHLLPNGITLYHAKWPGEKWQIMGFIMNVGARHDPVGLEGIAHFLEHVVSQSTTEDLDKLELDLEDIGGGMSLGTTSHNSTSYSFSAPIKGPYLNKVLNTFGEMILGLKNFKKIERERKVILSEFNQYYPIRSRFNLALKIRHILYPGFWLERQISPIGKKETIQKINEINLLDFYNRFYIPENLSIISIGGLSDKEIIKQLNLSTFNIAKTGEKTMHPTPIKPPQISTRRLNNTFTKLYGKKMRSKSSEILFVTTLHGRFNIPAIRIAEEMLNFELFHKIRQEHGLAYHVDVGRFRLISFSEFSIHLEGVKPGTEKKIENIFNNSLKDLSKNEELFKRFRKKSSNTDLIPDYSPFTIRRGAMSNVTFEGRITNLAFDRRESASVKFEDVKEIFKALEPENRLTNIITP